MKSFCTSVLWPLVAMLATILILGCQPTPRTGPVPRPKVGVVAPLPVPVPKIQPSIVAFGAEWCPACRAGQRKLDELQQRGVEVVRIDIDRHPEMAGGITSIPVYLVDRGPTYPVVRTQSIDEVVRLVDGR